MSKHTPGPWSVYEDCNKVAAHKAKFPAVGTMGTYYTESITDDRGEFYNPADALLIAAAPDMLEALQSLIACDFGANGWTETAEQAAIKARTAVLKATGEKK